MRQELVAKAVEPIWHEGPPVTVHVSEESPAMPYEAEMHRAFEINCLLRGRQLRHAAGHYQEIGSGEVCLVPGWEPHAWQCREPNTVVVTVLFLPEFLGDATIGGGSWLSLFTCPAPLRPRVRGTEMRREISALFQHLSRGRPTYTWRRRSDTREARGARAPVVGVSRQMVPGGPGLPPAWEDGVRYDVLRILVALYQGWEDRDHLLQRPSVRLGDLSAVMPAIQLTMSAAGRAQRATLGEAAEACSLSATHFRRVFRRAMGTTFAKFEARQRVAAAERLLHTTDLTLEAIAEHCGFVDASHLNRVFRSVYGHTGGFHREAVASQPVGFDRSQPPAPGSGA